MKENYYIIDNAGQYYIILKCTELKMNNYVNFGHKQCISYEGAIDLIKVSKWLITHNIKHTVVYNKINNPILRLMVRNDIKYVIKMATSSQLLIYDDEIEQNIFMNEKTNITYYK